MSQGRFCFSVWGVRCRPFCFEPVTALNDRASLCDLQPTLLGDRLFLCVGALHAFAAEAATNPQALRRLCTSLGHTVHGHCFRSSHTQIPAEARHGVGANCPNTDAASTLGSKSSFIFLPQRSDIPLPISAGFHAFPPLLVAARNPVSQQLSCISVAALSIAGFFSHITCCKPGEFRNPREVIAVDGCLVDAGFWHIQKF